MSQSTSYVLWRAFCEIEGCGWRVDRCVHREQAVSYAKRHAEKCKAGDGEWQVRVQGIRVGARPWPHDRRINGRQHEPHVWQPHPKSRNRSLPCGVCGIFRYVHDAVYDYVSA